MKLAPFTEWPIQTPVTEQLYNRLRRDTIPHAMLFVGDPAPAKLLTEYLAKTLLCVGDEAPCGQCSACKQFESGNHTDFHLLEAGSGSVKAGQIEDLQEALVLRSNAGARVVYTIRGIENATAVAANRLLKTVEEPNAQLIALFTAVNERMILRTIVSRCALFRLDGTGVSDTAAVWKNDENNDFGEATESVIQWTKRMLSGDEPPILLANAFQKSLASIAMTDALHILSSWLRDVLYVSVGETLHIGFSEYIEELKRQARLVSVSQMTAMISLVLDAQARLTAHVAPQLNLERLCIRLHGVIRGEV